MMSVDETVDIGSDSSDDDPKDILASMRDLSDELECIGLALKKFDSSDDNEEVLASLLSATWSLIQLHHSKIQELHRPDELIHRLTSDSKTLRDKINSLKETVAKKDRLLAISSEKQRQLQVKFDKVTADLKKEQAEVRRLKKHIEERDAKFNREKRKIQQDALRINSKDQPNQPVGLQEITAENLRLRCVLLRLDKELEQVSTNFAGLLKDQSHIEKVVRKQVADPIDFALEDCNYSCNKHLEVLYDVLEELLPKDTVQ